LVSKKFAVLAAALLAAACGNEATEPEEGAGTPQQAQVGDTVRLRLGASARIGTTGIVVSFNRVEGDSRCPIDAICVWQGDAAVRIELATNQQSRSSAQLHTTLDPKSVEYNGHSFRLIEVAPAPRASEPTRAEDYVVALEVTKR
jgi:hypothetical protein